MRKFSYIFGTVEVRCEHKNRKVDCFSWFKKRGTLFDARILYRCLDCYKTFYED